MGGDNIMKEKNGKDNYLRICKESGCMIANYNIENFDEESFIIPNNRDEKSGKFKVSHRGNRYINRSNNKGDFK